MSPAHARLAADVVVYSCIDDALRAERRAVAVLEKLTGRPWSASAIAELIPAAMGRRRRPIDPRVLHAVREAALEMWLPIVSLRERVYRITGHEPTEADVKAIGLAVTELRGLKLATRAASLPNEHPQA